MNNFWEIYFSKTQFLGINNFVKLPAMQDTWVWSLGWEDPLEEGVTAQFSSVAQLCPTLCDPMDCSMPGLPVHHQFPEFTQTHVHWIGDAIQPSHPLLSPSPPNFNLSQHRSFPIYQLFESGGQSIGVSASTCPSNEYSRLTSFRIDCFDFLAAQGTLKSLLQHHSSKASILPHSAFFTWLLEKP